MAVTILPIANGFYKSDSLPISAQECVGFYPNIPQAPALNTETLLPTPGISLVATSGALSTDVNRGSYNLDKVPYFVNGTTLYRVEQGLTLTTIGTISGTGRVSMAANGTQLMIIVPGAVSTGYIYTVSGGLVTITDVDFKANGQPQYAVYIDSFFVCTTDSKKFIKSASNDGTNWNALDFSAAEADPDDIVAPIVYNNQLFIGGTSTIEGFSNIGGTADFPFQRTGLYIDKGIFGAFTIVQASNTFMWIGGGKDESPAIWALNGNSPEKISTTAIDSLLQGFTRAEIADSFTWSYAQKGAYFVGFVLPTTTMVYDTISGRWHERKSFVNNETLTQEELVRNRINSLTSAYGLILVGDSKDGRIGSLDVNVFEEYDQPIYRSVSTQPFQNNMQAFFVPWIELTTESGVGSSTVTNPVINMSSSKDGGKIWTDPKPRNLGKLGEYNQRQIWRKLGRVSRFRIFRFTITDSVKAVIIQLTADIRGSS